MIGFFDELLTMNYGIGNTFLLAIYDDSICIHSEEICAEDYEELGEEAQIVFERIAEENGYTMPYEELRVEFTQT